MTRIYVSEEEHPDLLGVYDPDTNTLYVNQTAGPCGVFVLLQTETQLLLVL